MESDFDKRWNELMEQANELQLIRFIFEVNRIWFFSEWRKNKWSYPVRVDYL